MYSRKDAVEQITRDSHLSKLEGNGSGVTHDPCAGFDQTALQASQRLVGHFIRHISALQEDAEIVGQCVQLKADLVLLLALAGQPRPIDRLLAFLDMLLRRAALIVEDDNPLGGTGEVGYNEADPWIKFTRMPFDLGDNPAGSCPTGGPVAEVRVVASHLLWGPADRALQKISDVALQDCVRR